MPHDVFINHSTAGKLTAYAICSTLESIGIRCWILPRDLTIGIAWDQSIANAVVCSRIMIVVLSDYASRTDRVERQLELAFNNGLIIIPFRTESDSIACESQPALDPVHWLDTVTPETAQRLSSLCDLVRGFLRRQKDGLVPVNTMPLGQEEIPHLSVERISELPQREVTKGTVRVSVNGAVTESSDSDSEKNSLPPFRDYDKNDSKPKDPALLRPKKTSSWLPIRALLLTLLPFAIICGVGTWQAKKAHNAPPTEAAASIAPPIAEKVRRQEQISASNPGWGKLDANWTVADDKLRVTPLLDSSTVLINHEQGFRDAEISAEVLMSKGDDLDQLGGLIFWAKDYNDCYALVISADGKFAVGRKLIGRWINPIAKTGNDAIKTGIGETNKLRVRTEGNLLTAFINGIKVATLAGEPPQGVSFIGLYGESAERTRNVWEFTNVTVTSVH